MRYGMPTYGYRLPTPRPSVAPWRPFAAPPRFFRGLGATQTAAPAAWTQDTSQASSQSTNVTVYATGGSISNSANVGSQVGAVIEAARLNAAPLLLGVAVVLGGWLLLRSAGR